MIAAQNTKSNEVCAADESYKIELINILLRIRDLTAEVEKLDLERDILYV